MRVLLAGSVSVVRTAVCKNTEQYGVYHRRIDLFLTREVAGTGCVFVRTPWRHGNITFQISRSYSTSQLNASHTRFLF